MRSAAAAPPCPFPNPNPDASPPPPPAPMTPRAPQLRHQHQPPHLVLSEAVASWHPFNKKPCLSDRSTAPPAPSSSARLPDAETGATGGSGGGSFRWFGLRKRRRRGGAGSRSVSGRSSDRRRSGTCSDFHFTCGGAGGGGATDSSGEMWASDVGELRMRDVPMATEFGLAAPVGGAGAGSGGGGGAAAEAAAADSGYGSEPGYRGDVELGYGDEIDEEEEDGKQQLFWGGVIGDMNKMKINGDNNFGEQKSHHRCRRKKHDVRMLDSLS